MMMVYERCFFSRYGCFSATRLVVASTCGSLLGGRTGSIYGPDKPENMQVLLRLNDLLYRACRVHLLVGNIECRNQQVMAAW